MERETVNTGTRAVRTPPGDPEAFVGHIKAFRAASTTTLVIRPLVDELLGVGNERLSYAASIVRQAGQVLPEIPSRRTDAPVAVEQLAMLTMQLGAEVGFAEVGSDVDYYPHDYGETLYVELYELLGEAAAGAVGGAAWSEMCDVEELDQFLNELARVREDRTPEAIECIRLMLVATDVEWSRRLEELSTFVRRLPGSSLDLHALDQVVWAFRGADIVEANAEMESPEGETRLRDMMSVEDGRSPRFQRLREMRKELRQQLESTMPRSSLALRSPVEAVI